MHEFCATFILYTHRNISFANLAKRHYHGTRRMLIINENHY